MTHRPMTDASLVWEGWLEFTRLVCCALKRTAKARTKIVKEVVQGFLSYGIHPSILHEAAIHLSLATIRPFLGVVGLSLQFNFNFE